MTRRPVAENPPTQSGAETDGRSVPTPPMALARWGRPDEAVPLSASIIELVNSVLEVSIDDATDTDSLAPIASPSRLTTSDLAALVEIVGADCVTIADEQRLPRARGKSSLDLFAWRANGTVVAPDAVVAPRDEDEVSRLLAWCGGNDVAVVPFGGGTSVVGGISPLDGGHRAALSLDLAHFNALTGVDHESGLVTLGAGLSGPRAEELLHAEGLSLGHFPQSFPYATIGGYAATRSSGQDSAGYGRFDEMVRALTVVTPVGVIDAGHAAPASAAGPDLREMFLGSEGAFGVITRVRLRVHPVPAMTRYEAFSFPDFATGVAAVRAVEQQGTGPTVIRLSDETETSVNLATTDKIGDEQISSGCLCITLYEGTAEHTASRHTETRDLLLECGGTSLGEQPARDWEHGRFGAPVLRDALLDNGALLETLETATDWANIPRLKDTVTTTLTEALEATGTPALVMCHVSHVYPTGASLYFTVVAGQRGDPGEQWSGVKRTISLAIQAAGGTITHHHAVGVDHREFMTGEVGEVGLTILRAIKSALDPNSICNPGKLIP